MLHIVNGELDVMLADPRSDDATRGPRFCRGGLIWQVTGRGGVCLLAGPEYPSPSPSRVNGQGAPEVFQYTLFHHENDIPEHKLIFGVGLVDNTARATPLASHFDAPVTTYAPWTIEQRDDRICMRTRQIHAEWSYLLEKEVLLQGRTVRSLTHLVNTGAQPMPFRWFAHPFFPVTADLRCCLPEGAWTVPDNPGFCVAPDGCIVMRPGYDWRKGHFQELAVAHGTRFAASACHPRTGSVSLQGDFPLTGLALWANDRTFSPEPFHAGTLAPEAATTWSITYAFGAIREGPEEGV